MVHPFCTFPMPQHIDVKPLAETKDVVAPSRRALPVLVTVTREAAPLRPRPVKAQRALLPPDVSTADAFRLTLFQCKWHIAANLPAVIEARDVEGLHQLRVALRRLRVALASFGGEFRTPELEAIGLRAKSFSARIAPARDLDVFTQELLEPAASANGAKEAFALLRARAEAARRVAWNDTVMQIGGVGFRSFLHDLEEAVEHRLWPHMAAGGNVTKDVATFDAKALGLADRMLAYRRHSAGKRARHIDSLSPPDRHKLRIALKKLRYTAEFFAPLYEGTPVRKFISRLGDMQDALGGLNDVAVAQNTLEKLVAEPVEGSAARLAELNFVAGIVYGWHLERAARSWKDAVKRWKKFSRAPEFWGEAVR